jgi:hypothetical protein
MLQKHVPFSSNSVKILYYFQLEEVNEVLVQITLGINEQRCDMPTLLDHPLLEQHKHSQSQSKQVQRFHLDW